MKQIQLPNQTELSRLVGIGILVTLFALASLITSCSDEDEPGSQKPSLNVEEYYPNSGKERTLITIEGQGFGTQMEGYSITLGANSAEIISVNDTRIVFQAPAGEGAELIVLKNEFSTISVGEFTYQDLTISGLSSEKAPVGTNISILGEGFAGVKGTAKVIFNETEAKITTLDDKRILVTVPDGATSGPITVEVDGAMSKGPHFTVYGLYKVSPNTGGSGTKVRLQGSGFDEQIVSNSVYFNGHLAEILEVKAEELLLVAPEGVVTGAITLTLGETQLTGPTFTVVPPPTITMVSPLSGPKDTEMTIKGSGFSPIEGETRVLINGKEVTPISVSETSLTLHIPGNTGNGIVEVVVNDQISQEGPMFKDQTLGISSVTPDNGPSGTDVTILGTGFSKNAAENNLTINGIPFLIKEGDASETEIKTKIPNGASTGSIVLKVNGEEAISPSPFKIAGVSTLAGGPSLDVLSASLSAITVTEVGTVYATDPVKNQIIKIDVSGNVSLFAEVNNPIGITSDSQGNLFVVEEMTAIVHKITPNGQVSHFASTGLWSGATSIAADTQGNLYVTGAESAFSGWSLLSSTGEETSMFDFISPCYRMGIDLQGNVYSADEYTTNGKHMIGMNGTRLIGASSRGFSDGVYRRARFAEVRSMVVNSQNQLIAADYGNNALRLIDLNQKEVTTILKTEKGYQDGKLETAKVGEITDIAVSSDGKVYILDKVNRAIRVVAY